MTWSYNSTAPGSSATSWVRMRIGDTSSGDQLLSDEEINALIDQGGNKYRGGALAARSVGAAFARRTDKTVGRTGTAWSQASKAYMDLAVQLEREGAQRASVYAGGISASDVADEVADTDLPARAFALGQFDFDATDTDD